MHQSEVAKIAAEPKRKQTLRSALGGLLVAMIVDLTTPIMPRVAEHLKEAERAKLIRLFWDGCQLSEVEPRLSALCRAECDLVGSFSKSPGFAIDPVDSTGKVVGKSLEKKVRKYSDPRPTIFLNPNSDNWREAKRLVSCLFGVERFGKLRPVRLDVAAKSFPGNTGLGFPLMVNAVDKEAVAMAYQASVDILKSGFDRKWIELLPAVLGTRGGSRGPNLPASKRAVAQVFRGLNNFMKMTQMVAQPRLRDANPEIFCAWRNRQAVREVMSRRLEARRRKDQPLWLCADFEGFDASVPFVVIDACYEILANVFVREAGPLIRFNRDVMKRMGILCPGFRIRPDERTGGVPSGVVDTNLIDSLANLLVMFYTGLELKSQVLDVSVQGDDSCVRFQGNPKLSDIAGIISRDFGMTISIAKTTFERGQIHFLQDLYLDTMRGANGLNLGMRSIIHVLNHMMSYEKVDGDVWERLYDTVRWLMQLSECDDHPSFYSACRLYAKLDPEMMRVLRSIRDGDDAWLHRAVLAIQKKRSSLSWSISLDSFRSSAAVRRLLSPM